jgi:hypothetical protein
LQGKLQNRKCRTPPAGVFCPGEIGFSSFGPKAEVIGSDSVQPAQSKTRRIGQSCKVKAANTWQTVTAEHDPGAEHRKFINEFRAQQGCRELPATFAKDARQSQTTQRLQKRRYIKARAGARNFQQPRAF